VVGSVTPKAHHLGPGRLLALHGDPSVYGIGR